VKQGKKTYYVQTDEEMRAQLLDRGLENTSFEGEGIRVEGEDMRTLCVTLASMEDAILALERRGINLRAHSNRMDNDGRLPVFHAFLGTTEKWFTDRKKLDEFIKQHESESGVEVTVETDDDSPEGEEVDVANTLRINEFHEVRTINAGLKALDQFGLGIEAMLPVDRTGLENPRFILYKGDNENPVTDLRGLIAGVRALGEKGIHLTRFKGLGEMNAEELRETTLDPENRTLIQIKMPNVAEADDMFRILMGDKVEPRREFIEKYALDVRELDV
jgi:DNA gyrase subunit B